MHTSWPRTNMTTNQGLAVFFGTFESVFIFPYHFKHFAKKPIFSLRAKLRIYFKSLHFLGK